MARWLALCLLAGCLLAPPARADALQEALRERVEQLRGGRDLQVEGGRVAARDVIPDFYEARGFRPAWHDAGRRQELLAAVDDSRGHGLDPEDYQLEALRRANADGDNDTIRQAGRDLLFTEALIRLTRHLRYGKVDPRTLYPGWSFGRNRQVAGEAAQLETLFGAGDLRAAVAAHAPQVESYTQLRTALAHYRAVAATGGWPPVPDGPTLKPGMRDARVAALRARLLAGGEEIPELVPPEDADLFDDGLAVALARFQQRHGLEPDGLAGRRTRAALNVSAAQRIEQVRVNLERLRWVAQDLSDDYLVVDTAGFQARLYLERRLAWSSRVVVGRPYRKTPEFRATLQYLVLNPKWVVPPTILREDVLPAVVKDPAYLATHGMRVVDDAGAEVDAAAIDWAVARRGGFPYQVVQAAGPDNPLGRIKFMLPNAHAVYLHDTPSKELFRRTERAFSSGCIRLEQPLELAVLLLDDDTRWNLDSLRAEIDTGITRTVPVKRRVPVMMLYFTVAGDGDGDGDGEGGWEFRPDLYDRDPAVLAALTRPVSQPALQPAPASR